MMKSGTSKQARKPRKRKPMIVRGEPRNWLELPEDVMIQIFLKVGIFHILFNTQSVCSAWRKLATDPQLYRHMELWRPVGYFRPYNFDQKVNMTIEAIKRSCGQLVDFSIIYFGTDAIMHQILNTTSDSLKCLRLSCCDQVSDETMIQLLKKLPSLEELALSHCSFSEKVIEAAGQSCPHLKHFRMDQQTVRDFGDGIKYPSNDDQALAIAANMPQLHHLDLFGNDTTNVGLQAVLDGCPYLEYLDLRWCFRIDLKGDILENCKRIKILRLPNDPTDDYEFQDVIGDDVGDFASDFLCENYMCDLLELDLSDYEGFDFDGITGINYIDFLIPRG